jgi:diadenosine tetraphosphate (Ap4A) HIT family hydrolase
VHVPGHVLVATRAQRKLFADLVPAEVSDVWQLAQRVGIAVTRAFDAKGLQFAVQDGAASGQTVPHLHIHVLPRQPGDFKRNDDVYDAVEKSEQQLTRLDPAVEQREKDAARANRSTLDMEAEAELLREAMRTSAR